MAPAQQAQRHQFVQETDDFLKLWPHRHDYIQASFPGSGERPTWFTISNHPLTDRRFLQGGALFGVRFAKDTLYLMLDVDRNSRYHPAQDEFILGQLQAALEPLGFTRCLIVTSSDSGGLHLYFPFKKPQRCWRLAEAAAILLQAKGFKLQPGQLELFPNPRRYRPSGPPSLFNAHRLPLQEPSSHILNNDLEPIFSNQAVFVTHWQQCIAHNLVTASKITQVLRTKKRKRYFTSATAEKFLNDLNADINPGWTNKGQTNFLLGRITMRTFIFHHVITGSLPLSGQDLISEVVEIAQSLPGYKAFCRHQHELIKRVKDWVRCIENSHYFPYGNKNGKYKAVATLSKTEATSSTFKKNWHKQQAQETQTKISHAVQQLKQQKRWPEQTTARFALLSKEFHCGKETLYKDSNKPLWHPKFESQNTEQDQNPNSEVTARPQRANCHNPASLLSAQSRNFPAAQDLHARESLHGERQTRNIEEPTESQALDKASPLQGLPLQLKSKVLQALAAAQAALKAEKVRALEQQSLSQPEHRAAYLAQMKAWAASDDPILVQEGQAGLRALDDT